MNSDSISLLRLRSHLGSSAEDVANVQGLTAGINHSATKINVFKSQVFYGMAFDEITDDTIISVDEYGNVVSKFGDNVWILTQFRILITDKITFSFEGLLGTNPITLENVKLSKILFLMRLFSTKGTTKKLRITSHVAGFYSIVHLCNLANEHCLSIRSFMDTPNVYEDLLPQLAHQRASMLWQILKIFNITKSKSFWFSIPGTFMKSLKKIYKGRSHKTTNQHPVIPPRILHARWNNYHEVLDDFMANRTQIRSFIENAVSNRLYGRGSHSQYLLKKNGIVCQTEPDAPSFAEASEAHGLTYIFSKYKILDVPAITEYLSLVQYCAKSLIHILTLMRSGEALLLEQGCLDIAKGWTEEGVYILGVSTKATGSAIDTRWITTNSIQRPLQVVLELLDVILPFVPEPVKSSKNLFISPANIPISKSRKPALLNPCTSFCFESRLPLILIEDEDLFCLELIDPNREWRSEKSFQIGSPWKFTTHQFRRTMAVYCAEQDLMVVPALKRILGHLSENTSLYYQRGCAAGLFKMSEWSPKLVSEFKEAALDASNAIYIRDIIYSEERLHGLEGRNIQKSKESGNIVLDETLLQLAARRKKGLLACTTSPVGLCLSVTPCNKRAIADFSTCDGCSWSVIKLSKLDHTIETLGYDLQNLDPDSIEWRMDNQTLNDLLNMRTRLMSKQSNGIS